MTFAQPQFLYLLAAIPVIAVFLLWASRRSRAAIAGLGDSALIGLLTHSVNRTGRRWRTWLWIFAFAFAVVAVARPQWGSAVEVVEQRGLQIMMALDVSGSMLAEDIKPNRLARAKLELSDLLNRLSGDEVGLVVFSGAAFKQSPLTFDYATTRSFLNSASPSNISRPGTALAEAIDASMAGFNPKRASQKVVIIVTDGEGHEGEPIQAARRVAKEGVVIYTVGLGSLQGEPIPERDEAGNVVGYKKDAAGQVVLSRLDEVTLQEIALATGGKYFRAGADGGAVESLWSELEGLQRTSVQSEFETRRIERFQLFLLAALLALFAAELFPDRVPSWTLRRSG